MFYVWCRGDTLSHPTRHRYERLTAPWHCFAFAFRRIWFTIKGGRMEAATHMARQLQMLRPDLERLPDQRIPAGYALRTWLPGDEQAWASIMNTGIGADWTAAKVAEQFSTRPQFTPDAVFFAILGGRPVGTAAAWRIPETETRQGYVHMVCVLPEHRGKGLGYLVTLATLHWFKQHGFASVLLETDDWRLAAIRVYLQLGFAPRFDTGDAEMAERWQKVMGMLSSTST